jgi:hypothetical protein
MRKIALNQVLSCIKAGVGDDQLMKNNRLRPKAFGRLLLKLVDRGLVAHEDLYKKSSIYRNMSDILNSRHSPRLNIRIAIRVYDRENSRKGFIRDISEGGVRVAGLDAQVGECLTLFVPQKELISRKPFEFDAVCHWTKVKGKTTKYTQAGFKIVNMSDDAREQLLSLIDLLRRESAVDTQAPLTALDLPEASMEMRWKTTTRDFSGTIGGVDSLDLVQLILLSGRKIVLDLVGSGGAECTLYFDDGRLVHAVLRNLQGEEAFLQGMNLPGGKFSTRPWSEPTIHSIDLPGDLLLMEAARRRDEANRHVKLDKQKDDEEAQTMAE